VEGIKTPATFLDSSNGPTTVDASNGKKHTLCVASDCSGFSPKAFSTNSPTLQPIHNLGISLPSCNCFCDIRKAVLFGHNLQMQMHLQ